EKNKTYLFIRQKIRHQFGLAARKLIWSLYLEELKKKEVDLKTLREQFSNPSPDFPHCFFSTPFDTWKQLLEFNQEEERFWKALWDQGKTPNPSWLQTIACYVGIQKPAKQAFTELIAQRLAENHEASTGCQTLVAISRAKATVITEEKMLAAQAEQLNQLEVYFSSKMTVLYAYINKQNKLLDDNEISFFLWIQTCLGFKKAIEESESITQLSELKTLAYTKITNSTLNILNAVTAAKSSRHSWNDLQFKAIKEYLDKLHLTIHCETTVLTSAINQHNEKFRNEWNFWPRKKTLKNLFESISKECPVGLRMS
ncbi:MAG TPA: hypothetical protein VLH77_05010, partial [Gammaproteobacteria bacterium]|nr:hypothetical protein [Gammaproteobacteria bacterium]